MRSLRLTPCLGLLLLAAACGSGDADSADLSNNRNAGAADAGTFAGADAANAFDAGGLPAGDAGVSGDASALPADECNPVDQTGCAPPDLKCVVEGPGSGTECVAPSEELPLGAACEGRDCAAGLACARSTTTATASVCVKVCDLESGQGCESLGPDFECRTRLTDTNWGACRELAPTCDPYSQAPCARDEACQPFLRRTGTWEFRCRAAGPGAEGEVCGPAASGGCARGLACVSTRTGDAYCRVICEVNTDCPGMAQCNGVVSEPAFMYCSE